MQPHSLIFGIIFLVLIGAALFTMIKYPRDIFLTAPKFLFTHFRDRLVSTLVFATSIIWLPLWLLDKIFKWGIFDKERYFRRGRNKKHKPKGKN